MDVRAENLSMQYRDGERAIDVFSNLNFHIPSGTSVALVGESGVGKTTLLNILGGLEIPTSGNIFLGSENISAKVRDAEDLAAFRGRKIGFVFQQYHLFAEFDALENVAMPLILQGKSLVDSKARAEKLLRRVGLGERLHHRPGMLSGGEQQRVAIARALSAQPGLILADEPTGNLDLKTGRVVRDLLLEIQREEKMTLIIATHSLELAGELEKIVELTPTGMNLRKG